MKRNGFTLIELAIVLTIVGLVIGGSFKALKYSRQKAYISEAKESVSAATDSIIGYSMEFVDLPTWMEFARDLAPIDGKVSDLNRSFFYFADPQLQNDEDVCNFNTTNLHIDVYSGGSFDHNISDVAFVVAAQSANKNIQVDAEVSGGANKIKIYDASEKIDNNTKDFDRDSDEFDDVIKWVTLRELKSLVKCKDSIEIITNNIPLIDINTTYNVYIFTNDEPLKDYHWSTKIDTITMPMQNDINYTCDGVNQGAVPTSWLSPTITCKKLGFSIKYKSTLEPTHKVDVNISDDYGNFLVKSYSVSQK
jgi:prepilin-type N-terminal cleavage/methylation domain-containing protein